MFNPLSLIPSPYLWLAKGIALLGLLLSLWYAWHRFTGHYIDIGKAEIQQKWDKKKDEQTALANQQIAENAIKLAKGKIAVNFADQSATAQLTQLNLDRQHETDNLKALYENKIVSIKHNLANRVQSSTTSSTSTLPNIASDTEATATTESIDNTAITKLQSQYDTLEKACTIETVDYNNLRTWADASCEIVECK